jgi:K+-transporting ATPase KdpF subunit
LWAFWRCGASQRPANGSRRLVMFDYVVSLIVAILLLAYLGWAMFKPEKF